MQGDDPFEDAVRMGSVHFVFAKDVSDESDTVEGLASGAPLTLFDEVHHGMDAPSRNLFYDTILDQRAATGRTFILSTHLVSETAYLFDHVLILHHGSRLCDEPQDTLLERETTVTGEAGAVSQFTADKTVIDHKRLGPTAAVMLYGTLSDQDRAAAETASLELAPASLLVNTNCTCSGPL